MSEPIRHEESAAEIPLSNILLGTAFISSSGRVYRLFDETETPLPPAPVFEHLVLPPEERDLQADQIDSYAAEYDAECDFLRNSRFDSLIETASVLPPISPTHPFPLPKEPLLNDVFVPDIPVNPTLPLNEMLRRHRAVEGVCPAQKQSWTLLDEASSEEGTPRLELYRALDTPVIPAEQIILPFVEGVRSEEIEIRNEKIEVRSEEIEVRDEKIEARNKEIEVTSQEPSELPTPNSCLLTSTAVSRPIYLIQLQLRQLPVKRNTILRKERKSWQPETERSGVTGLKSQGYQTSDEPVTTGVPTAPGCYENPVVESLESEVRSKENEMVQSSLVADIPFPACPAEPAVQDEENEKEQLSPVSLLLPPAFRWPHRLESLQESAANQIQSLADHLVVQFNQGHNVVSFNGFCPGDGCSTLILCAARELTNRGYRLLLADAHSKHPDLPQQIGLTSEPGEKITLIPDKLDLLSWSGLMAGQLALLRDRYDLVLLDGGSLTESPLLDHIAFWRDAKSDGVILVLNTKNQTETNAKHIAQRLRQHHILLLGIAENYV